jgi:large subunit ribosomal protein L21
VYAVIRTGGKQEKVREGQRVAVEWIDAPAGAEVELEAVLVVDGSRVLARPEELGQVTVRARVLGDQFGPKIRAGTYKAKTNQRRRWGHRQRLSTLEVLAISAPGAPVRPGAAG